MDAAPIKAITDARATINKECLITDGISIIEATRVNVQNYDAVEAIAEIIYGTNGWEHVHVNRDGGWTTAWVKSPEDVEFYYSDFNIDDAYFHVREAKRMEDGSWELTDKDVKAVV